MIPFLPAARVPLAVQAATLMAGLLVSPTIAQPGQSLGSADHVHVIRVIRDDTADVLSISVSIDRGYHVNANPASSPYLIPTWLEFASVVPTQVTYPPGFLFKTKFTDEAISVYEGTVAVEAHFPPGSLNEAGIIHGIVVVQACTVDICLPPSDLPVVSAP